MTHCQKTADLLSKYKKKNALYVSHSPAQVKYQGFYSMFLSSFAHLIAPSLSASYSYILRAESLLQLQIFLRQLWPHGELTGQKAQWLALNLWPAGQSNGAGAKRRAWRIEIKPQAIRAGQSATGTLMLHHIHRSAVTASADRTDPSRLMVWASISICVLEERDC